MSLLVAQKCCFLTIYRPKAEIISYCLYLFECHEVLFFCATGLNGSNYFSNSGIGKTKKIPISRNSSGLVATFFRVVLSQEIFLLLLESVVGGHIYLVVSRNLVNSISRYVKSPESFDKTCSSIKRST